MRDFFFKRPDCLPEEGDRPLFTLGKMLACFLNLQIVSSWSTNGTRDGAAKRGVCDEGAGVEYRGQIVPHVRGCAVPNADDKALSMAASSMRTSGLPKRFRTF